jgi:hypothetical protein
MVMENQRGARIALKPHLNAYQKPVRKSPLKCRSNTYKMNPKTNDLVAKIRAVRARRGGYIYKWTGVAGVAKPESATEWGSKSRFWIRFRATVA